MPTSAQIPDLFRAIIDLHFAMLIEGWSADNPVEVRLADGGFFEAYLHRRICRAVDLPKDWPGYPLTDLIQPEGPNMTATLAGIKFVWPLTPRQSRETIAPLSQVT